MFSSYMLKKCCRILVAPALIGVVGLGGYAFTAANTVPATKAGDGAGAISGYTVSGVSYSLNATNPSNIDSVAFSVNTTPPAGSKMKVKLVASGSTWYNCTNVATALTCATTSPQATVASADELRVVIAD